MHAQTREQEASLQVVWSQSCQLLEPSNGAKAAWAMLSYSVCDNAGLTLSNSSKTAVAVQQQIQGHINLDAGRQCIASCW